MNKCKTEYFNHNYNLFLEKQSNDFEILTFNCSGIHLDGLLKIIQKISKCTKLNKLLVLNISSEYADKIDFNFLADFELYCVEISFTFPAHHIIQFVTSDNCLILANTQTNLDVNKIISTNFSTNTKIDVRMDKLKQVATIMNNLSLGVKNLTLNFNLKGQGRCDYYEEICDFIDNGLNNLPISLLNFTIDYKKTLFNSKNYTNIIDKLNNIKVPFGCVLDVKNYNFLAGKMIY